LIEFIFIVYHYNFVRVRASAGFAREGR